MLHCSDAIAYQAYELYQCMETQHEVPAILAFDGIQYSYMAPQVFSDECFAYVEEQVSILSGYYGILKPLDGVVPYRLELDQSLPRDGFHNLYTYWGNRLYKELTKKDHEILDLASRQYSRIITRYEQPLDHIVRCYFMEAEHGNYREKGVYVKMARGEMVRYLAEINARNIEDAKGFCGLGYRYQKELSNENKYVFTRHSRKK